MWRPVAAWQLPRTSGTHKEQLIVGLNHKVFHLEVLCRPASAARPALCARDVRTARVQLCSECNLHLQVCMIAMLQVPGCISGMWHIVSASTVEPHPSGSV
jgi:hypothetical protein